MKRTLLLLVSLVLAVGCAKPVSKAPVETTSPPAPSPAPAAQTEPTPKPPEPPKEPLTTEGPVSLLSQPDKPLWPGPVTVAVENSPQSRPQAGLNEADMVVEGLSESEITRFLAFYWTKPAARIGPVRSARTWLVAMADAYGATFSHAGGNMDALAILRNNWGPSNLDEIYGSGQYFTRISERVPPHNLYTSTQQIGKAVTERQIALRAPMVTPRSATPFPASGGVTQAHVNWHKYHQTVWEWKDGRYLRTDDGEPHTMEGGGGIGVPNLVFLQIQGVNNGWELGWDLNFSAGGQATVVTGGQSWAGAWKLGPGGFVLTPASGKVPLLQPGGVWVHLITEESSFTIGK